MGRLFGTDGVRGRANADLTPELALAVAVAAAQVLLERDRSPRARWPWSAGTRGPAARCWRRPWSPGSPAPAPTCVRVGVLPTPAVAFLTGALGADLGVMLSASHNPMPDNGIKLFAARRAQAPRRGRGRDRGG